MNGEVTIDIKAQFMVTDETAARCLAVVGYWLEDNPGFTVRVMDENGKRVLRIVPEEIFR